MYAKYFKRGIDFILSLCALIGLSPVLLILMILGTVFMGGNPFFTHNRPGKDEKIFKLIKFSTMSNKKDKDGNLLPDELRLNKYGKFLRASSLDGYDIIGQTRKGLENRGFREVSPMSFLDNHTRFGWYSCDMRIATV